MKYKLISTDLDGTLLNSNERITEQNDIAMKTLRDKGVIIAVNTGRTLYEIPQNVRDNKNIDYFICSNGAAIYNNEKKLVLSCYLNGKIFSEIFKTLNTFSTAIAVHDSGLSIIDKATANVQYWMDNRASEYSAKNFISGSEAVEDFAKRYEKPREVEMICCCFKHQNELEKCRKEFENIPEISLASSMGINIEVFNKNTDKGIMLEKLCEKLSICKNEIIGVGDSQNDSAMLKSTGLSLATENAVQILKDQADAIICDCNSHIMKGILKKYYEN